MAGFDIFTDSSCDLPKEMVEQYDVKVMQLEVLIDDNPPMLNKDVDIDSFYEKLSAGSKAKTAAVTPGYFEEHMRNSLDGGKDILYIGFSSGLSATYNNGVMVIEDLKEEYKDRKILHLDSLCASVGQGLLVYYAALLKEKGATIDEVEREILAIKDKIHHQVVADDLFFLKRGGRISATTAIAGSMLKIKPIIDMTIEGKLDTVGKIRGRKNALKELIARMEANQDVDKLPYVFISHSACLDDAKTVSEMVKENHPNVKVVISDIGPVIGAHTGPGTMALCYLGNVNKGM